MQSFRSKNDEESKNTLVGFSDKKIAVIAPGSTCSNSEMQGIKKCVSQNKNIKLFEYTDIDSEKALETMEEVETELLSMLKELKAKALLKPKAETIDAEIIEDDRDDTEDNK